MGELIDLLNKNDVINSYGRVADREIHLVGADYDRVMELIKQLENKD